MRPGRVRGGCIVFPDLFLHSAVHFIVVARFVFYENQADIGALRGGVATGSEIFLGPAFNDQYVGAEVIVRQSEPRREGFLMGGDFSVANVSDESAAAEGALVPEIGRASCRERV